MTTTERSAPHTDETLDALLVRARACRLCTARLPLGPKPIVQAHAAARLLIVSQAPGTRAHASGIPWDDASGDRLRDWLGLDRDAFYDPRRVAILPSGFCYPGRGAAGDLPPRPECAPTWHPAFLARLPNVALTLLVGAYAQARYLDARGPTLTATVRGWREHDARTFPLPHPSPRNNVWLQRNPWFARDVLPALRARVAAALRD